MEHEKIFILGAKQQLEVELPNACEEIDVPSRPKQNLRNPTCSFSKQEHEMSDSEQRSKSTVKLCVLIIFYVIVMAVEVAGGLKANSLAVLTDAAHLLTDIAGFSISLFTIWASGWKATSKQSFGFNRLEVLGALLSTQLIWLISGALIYEAIDRMLQKDEEVNGKVMFAIAAFGFVINFIMVIWLGHGHSHHACISGNHQHHHHHDHESEDLCTEDEEGRHLVSNCPDKAKALDINLQGAYLHVMVDLIQTVGVMIAGSIIWAKPNWLVVDLLCTLIFSVFALSTTLPMLKNVIFILMERTPDEVDIDRLEHDLKYMKGVHAVRDLHVWAITNEKFVMSCHVKIEPGVNSNEILHKVRDHCERIYRIHHVTIQIEQEY